MFILKSLYCQIFGGFQKFCKNISEIVTRTQFLHKIFPKMTIVLQNSRQFRPDINLPLLGLSGNSCTIVCCSYLHSSDKTTLIHLSSFQHIKDYSIKCYSIKCMTYLAVICKVCLNSKLQSVAKELVFSKALLKTSLLNAELSKFKGILEIGVVNLRCSSSTNKS